MPRWFLALVLVLFPVAATATGPDLGEAFAPPLPTLQQEAEEPLPLPGPTAADSFGLRRGAYWGGVAGTVVGLIPAGVLSFVVFEPAIPLIALAVVPFTAGLGVHLLSDGRGYGWKVLGGLIGMTVAAGPAFFGVAGGVAAAFGGLPGLTAVFFTAAGLCAILVPPIGTWLAARSDGRKRGAVALLPVPRRDGGALVLATRF